MAFKFESLRVWQDALAITNEIHLLTKFFPKDEIYILSSQIKRAADSICLNIAEGSTGQSDKEQHKFLGYALRSSIEVITCLYIAEKRELIDKTIFTEHYNKLTNLIISIQAFRKAVKKQN
ncbi:MAG: four helix bundle protein [Chitinophagales bacterium]|nr:four helix bundle protein [Chitinophagales bacterium]